MNELSKTIKSIALIGILIGIAAVFGNVINSFIPWQWATIIFTILRRLILYLDFGINTAALFVVISIWLNILVAYWIYLGSDWIINRLRK